MTSTEALQACHEYQAATDVMWQRLLPLAGPQALRVFMVRSVVDRGEGAPWFRQLRFFGDGRPAWTSVEPMVRHLDRHAADEAVAELMNSVAVKTVEQFGLLPARRGPPHNDPPHHPVRRAA